MQHVLLGLAVLVQLQSPAAPVSEGQPAAAAVAPVTPIEPAATTTSAPKSLLPPKTKPRLLVIDINDKGAGPEITNAVTQAVQAQALESHTGETIRER